MITRTYPNLGRVTDPETRDTMRIVYDLIYKVADDGEAAREELNTTVETLRDLIPEVEGLGGPSLFASAGGLGPGHYVAADVQDRQVMVVSAHSPSRVLFRQLVTGDLHDVRHIKPYASGDVLVYDEPSGKWVGQASGGIIDHGGLLGLGDDDHVHYLKEEAFGGLASEVPDHTHVDPTECGTIDHADLIGVTSDQHHALIHTHQNAGEGGQIDHGLALVGLGDDDHTQYALLLGRAGGQTLHGGNAANNDLALASTSHATNGDFSFGTGNGVNPIQFITACTIGAAAPGTVWDAVFWGQNNLAAPISYAGIRATCLSNLFGAESGYIEVASAGPGGVLTWSRPLTSPMFANLDMGGFDIVNVDDIVGNGASKISGGTGAGDDLYLYSTTNAAKGTVILGDLGGVLVGGNVDMNNKDITNIDDIIGNGASVISGGSGAGDDLFLYSTTNAGKGTVFLGDTGGITAGGDLSMASKDILGVDDIVGNSGTRLAGGSVAGTFLVLESTTHANKGFIWFGWAAGMIYDETNENLRIDGHVGIGGAVVGGTRLNLTDPATCYLRVETTGVNLAAHLVLENSNVGNAQRWDILNDGSAVDVFCIKDNTAMTTPFVIGKAAPTSSFIMLPSGYVGLSISPAARLDVYLNASGVYACNIKNDQASAGHALRVETDGTGAGTIAVLVNTGLGDAFKIWGGRNSWFGGDVDMGGNDISNMQDGVSPLIGREMTCRIFHNVNQNIANAVWVPITFNSERFDDAGMHNPAVNPTRITPGVIGTYLIGGCLIFQANVTGRRILAVFVNGATQIVSQEVHPALATGMQMTVTTLWRTTNVADYFVLQAFQTSGGVLAGMALGDASPNFFCQRVA